MSARDADRVPGFAGMLAAGASPEAAWQEIRDTLAAAPDACAVIAGLRDTPEGRLTLEWSRAAWARQGLPAPWEGLIPDGP